MTAFQDKVVLAVGGAGYLASPACEQMAAQGAQVVITDIALERAQALAARLSAEYGARCLGLACDVSQTESMNAVLQTTLREFGRVDTLINAAYKGSHQTSLEAMDARAFGSAAEVQLTGTFHLAREAAKHMKAGSSMVFLSSMYGRIAPEPAIYHEPMLPNPIDYGVVKAGLEQMIRYLAVYYGPRGIRVNGIAPGAFPHPGDDSPAYRGFVERLARKAPMNRVGQQHEIAGPLLFLASDAASFVTGHTLVVDGGWTIW